MANKDLQQSFTIDELWHGTSDRSPWHTRRGQVQSATNVRFSLIDGGAVKRGPTTLVTDLSTGSSLAALEAGTPYHFVAIRGAIVAIGLEEVLGWDANGTLLTIVDSTPSAATLANYLATPANIDPLVDIVTTVSHDTIVVLNRQRTTDGISAWDPDEAFNYIASGDATDTTETATQPSTFAWDTLEDASADAVSLARGDYVRVKIGSGLTPAGHYLYFPNGGSPDAYSWTSDPSKHIFPEYLNDWYRIPKSKAEGQLDPDTMPYRIVYDEGAGTLTISQLPWKQRLSGGRADNPTPSWNAFGHNAAIRSVLFHDHRLFLIGDDAVTASRRSDYFNFFYNDVDALADDDRLDVGIAQSDVGEVLHAASMGQSVFIACEKGQLQFWSGDQPLSSSNGSMGLLTRFVTQDVQIGSDGNRVTMLDTFGDVHQYRWTGLQDGIVYASLLTAHHQSLLYGITVTRIFQEGESVFMTTSGGNTYVHDSFLVGGEMVQSAWSVFSVYEAPAFVDAWGGQLRIVTGDSTEGYTLLNYIHRQQAPPTGMLFTPHLDRLELIPTSSMVYDADAGTTTMTPTGRMGTTATIRAVNTDSHVFLTPTSVASDGTATFSGDLTDADHYIGFKYTSAIVLTRLYPVAAGIEWLLKEVAVFHRSTTDYTLSWSRRDGASKSSAWQYHRVGESIVDMASTQTHFARFLVEGANSKTDLTLSSDSPGPTLWTGLEYVAENNGRDQSA